MCMIRHVLAVYSVSRSLFVCSAWFFTWASHDLPMHKSQISFLNCASGSACTTPSHLVYACSCIFVCLFVCKNLCNASMRACHSQHMFVCACFRICEWKEKDSCAATLFVCLMSEIERGRGRGGCDPTLFLASPSLCVYAKRERESVSEREMLLHHLCLFAGKRERERGRADFGIAARMLHPLKHRSDLIWSHLCIYSAASMPKYADPVIDIMDPAHFIEHRLFRDACVQSQYVPSLSQNVDGNRMQSQACQCRPLHWCTCAVTDVCSDRCTQSQECAY